MAAKAPQERVVIESEKDLKKHAVSILRRINEDERGGLMFLLNPVFALEEAGFDSLCEGAYGFPGIDIRQKTISRRQAPA